MKLDNLCWIWDNNEITIEGIPAWAISEGIATRVIAYGWNFGRVGNASDVEALACAIKVFKTTLNEFKTRERYIRDDYRFRDRFSKQNPRKVRN